MRTVSIEPHEPQIDGQAAAPPQAPVGEADHDLTVIIPAFNEEKRLPWTLCQVGIFLEQWGIDYRVVVADDGSSDGTHRLTDSLGPRFSTVHLPQHRGKGFAVRTAMLRATGRIVAFTDADLPYELTALRQGYQWINDGACTAVFGARDIEGSVHVAARRLSRVIATAGFRKIVKHLISREVTDTQCGLKLFGRRAAREIFSRATIDGFAFDAEVVFLARRMRLPFRRVPVSLIHDYDSTLSLRRHALPMLWDVIWLRLRDWFGGRQGPLPGWPPLEASPQQETPAPQPLQPEERKLAA
jgi:dolichyl-phosphate beta-glucosyltransferase